MQPMPPPVRAELKRIYPELTDADIDRYESLTSRRVMLDPDRDSRAIREIDAERERLVRTKMPRLADIENAYVLRNAEERPPKPDVRPPGDRKRE